MRLFEVAPDASLLAWKRSTLADAGFRPRTAVVDVAASTADPGQCAAALLAAGLDPRIPTRWVIEPPLLDGVEEATAAAALFEMASENGGTPASGVAAQVVESSWATHLAQLGMTAPPTPPSSDGLASVDAALEACRRAGWREKKILRQADFAETYKRSPHESFALIFAEADPK